MPSRICHAMSPVDALTAVSRPHGGFWHGQFVVGDADVEGAAAGRPVTLVVGKRRAVLGLLDPAERADVLRDHEDISGAGSNAVPPQFAPPSLPGTPACPPAGALRAVSPRRERAGVGDAAVLLDQLPAGLGVLGSRVCGVEERPVAKSDVPGELAFPTQPFPVKPAPLARVTYAPTDLVVAADTTPEHVKACEEMIEKNGGVTNAGPFTPWRYRAEGAPASASLVFPGGLGGANWGGTSFDPDSRYVFVATGDVGALGWVEKAKDGSPLPYDKTSLPGGNTFAVRMAETNWPCQKPPWGRLTAVNTTTGDIAWQIPLGITDQLPVDKQHTGRPVLAGAIVTGGGVLFIGSTDDNRFRALATKSGKELWVTKLDRRGNANPITYQGRNGKQYVAVVATDTLLAYALP